MTQKKKWLFLIFSLFFLYLLAQYQLIYMQYDDFGYCSLSYGYNAGIDGSNMKLESILDWFIHAYTFVNGRIFTNIVFVLTAWAGGIGLFRVFFPLCILGIFSLIYSETAVKLESDGKKIIMAAVLLFSYGLFSIGVCKEGLYWFAAAFGYVLPILLLLIFIKMYRKKMKLQILLAFLLCISCEQMVAMIFFFLVTSMVISIFEKEKIGKIHFITCLMAAVGSCIMVLSPASQNRMVSEGNKAFYELRLFERILYNINKIVNIFFNVCGALFVSFVLLLFILASLLTIRYYKSKILAAINTIYILLTLTIWWCYVSRRLNLEGRYVCYALFLYLVVGFINLIMLYIKINIKFIPIIAAAMASIGLLLIVPEIPGRTFIPFIFMTIYIMADIITQIIKSGRTIVYACLCIPYMLLMLINLNIIYKGYEANAEVFKYNEAKLIETRELLQNGITVQEVQLYRLINDKYGAAQAYHNEVKFMKWWIDEYYSISHEVDFVYYNYGTRENEIVVKIID